MISPDQQRTDVQTQISRAVILLEESTDPRLVAKTGTNIGYAITGARDSSGVAAINGGFVVRDNCVFAGGPCEFGADAEMARVVLTSTKFDPAMRCAATIRFFEPALRILESMFLECAVADRNRPQPPGVSTMDWGVASCCKDGVPEAVVDYGTSKETAVIHLFGEKPADVAGNIIMLSNRIIRIEL
ncbi:MAG: phosphomethylpyrimidine kinase [Methanoregula sp.]|nr:phosphomethylpyrimidine kinase [Methanoregula sp.]